MNIEYKGDYNKVPINIFSATEMDDALGAEWAKTIEDKIVNKLKSLKLQIEHKETVIGHTTTTILLLPADSVRMSRFRYIEDDLAIAIGSRCRVIAPVPDTNYIGIEVPTKARQVVGYGDIYGKGINEKMELPISIGVKTNGDVLGFDLAKMPHLLVAGASGQGKSVGLNVILMSLLSNMEPYQLDLYLIDPKKVEFSEYEPLKRLKMLQSLDTEPDKAINTLAHLCNEVDSRFRQMQEAGVRKISDYNKQRGSKPFMPYIVCVVDEFSDLMMTGNKRKVENSIIRIAQLGRAAGVHLIIATQRPDADVITGLIKANFPARIAFRTSTGTDSRIIIDRNGAEKLTGNGDMLFLHNGDTTRAQCAYVSDMEIFKAIEHCVNQDVEIAFKSPIPSTIEPESEYCNWSFWKQFKYACSL